MSGNHSFEPQIIETKYFTTEISTSRSFTSQIITGQSFTIEIFGLFITTALRVDLKQRFVFAIAALKETLNLSTDINFGSVALGVVDSLTQFLSISMSAGKAGINAILKQALSILSVSVIFPTTSIISTLRSTISETVDINFPTFAIVATPEVRKYTLLLEIDPDTLISLDPDTLTDVDYTLV